MNTKQDNLSVPQVAVALNVHRNTVLYWIRQGFIKATVKNALTTRPQYSISPEEVKRIIQSQNVAPKPTA
jgi:predicted site-specific integrase-resolvase